MGDEEEQDSDDAELEKLYGRNDNRIKGVEEEEEDDEDDKKKKKGVAKAKKPQKLVPAAVAKKK